MLTASYITSKGSASIIHLWATVSSNGFVSNVIRKSDVALSNEDRRQGFTELSGRPLMWKESIFVSNLHGKDKINISNWYIYKVFFKWKIIKNFTLNFLLFQSAHTKQNTQLLDLTWKRLIHSEPYSHVDFYIKKAMKG